MTLRQTAERHPILFSIGSSIFMLLALRVASTTFGGSDLGYWSRFALLNALGVGLGLVLLRALGWTVDAGFRLPREWPVLWLPAVLLALMIATGFRTQRFHPITYLHAAAFGLAIALVEEIWQRAIVVRALRRFGPFRAAFLSAAIFGLAHLSAHTEWPLGARAFQVFYAFADGALYAALLIRTRSLVPAVLLHAATDFDYYLLSASERHWAVPQATARRLVLFGVVLAYAAYLLAAAPAPAPAPEPEQVPG